MTKLAIYDKNRSERDMKKLSYFRNDYVYRQNIGVRFGVLIGCLIVILLNFMHKIVIDNIDVFSGMDYQEELMGAAVFVVVVVVAYSLIGTIVYMADYQNAKKRQRRYIKMLDALDQLNHRETQRTAHHPNEAKLNSMHETSADEHSSHLH
jgi:hypothetical protein